jgi:hypothetical protein
MAWTHDQAVEYGKQNASKGGKARALRLSAERRWDIAVLANAAKQHQVSDELDLINRELNKLQFVEAYALKNDDLNLLLKTISKKIAGIERRLRVRERLSAAKQTQELQQRREDKRRVCEIAGCDCGGELKDHSPLCVIRNCRCAGCIHKLLRRTGPCSSQDSDISEWVRLCVKCQNEFLAETKDDTGDICKHCAVTTPKERNHYAWRDGPDVFDELP